MLAKHFHPKDVESSLYAAWKEHGCFKADPTSTKPAFSMMMPPPNVTGALHIGHALNGTIQDVLVRFKRHMGFDVLWQPGIDHAGIATQFIVEKQLKAEGTDRRTLGREKFLERVWQWKNTSGGIIFNQMERLGISPDWERSRFTMDDGLSAAVKSIFIMLYRDGLIYKDKRLVNWDTSFQTAISDLEVVNRDVKGKMYTVAYALVNPTKGCTHLHVATTRPETLFGDVAVAVHPEDARYQHLINSHVYLPLTDRTIPIIADAYCDQEFGTGAVKITPAHDFNDFEVGTRHDLPFINILTPQGTLSSAVPQAFQGLSCERARIAVVAALEESGALIEAKDHKLSVPFSEKSDVRVEPYLTDQWFVNVESLAREGIEAVQGGHTTFFPKQWENTYFDWLKNIQPWCISRQIWWGHRIPAWYGPDGKVFVAAHEEEAQSQAKAHYGSHTSLTQEEDVLDTWFSSALWPFSTLGWTGPHENDAKDTQSLGLCDMNRYYPTSVLVTGFDIIFFWVARMMMFGRYTQRQVPFEKIYIHALVRDESGQKMSKTKGNVLNPLDLIDAYGADALRFALAISAAPGRDIKIGTAKVELYRNFLTKVWNAGRFLMMQHVHAPEKNQDQDASLSDAPARMSREMIISILEGFDPASVTLPLCQWIISGACIAQAEVTGHLNAFRFDLAAKALYHFVWDVYCDFFLEFMKPVMNGEDEAARQETLQAAFWVYKEVVTLMEPFAPFMTQTLWQDMFAPEPACPRTPSFLCNVPWTAPHLPAWGDARFYMNHVMHLVKDVRRMRAEYRIPVKTELDLSADQSPITDALSHNILKKMGRLHTFSPKKMSPSKGAILITVDNVPYMLDLGDSVDIQSEINRLSADIKALEKDKQGWEKRLSNPGFVANAKAEIIDEFHLRVEQASQDIAHKTSMMQALQATGR